LFAAAAAVSILERYKVVGNPLFQLFCVSPIAASPSQFIFSQGTRNWIVEMISAHGIYLSRVLSLAK
jgi:hypothetical protein